MRTLRTILIAVLALCCIVFLFPFVHTHYFLSHARDARGIHFLAEPHICVYRPFTHAHGERDGWTFFLLADSPEGTRPVFYFPTWPLAVVSAGVLIHAAFSIFESSDKSVG